MKLTVLPLNKEVDNKLVLLEEKISNLIYPVGLQLDSFNYETAFGSELFFSLEILKQLYPDDIERTPFSATPNDFPFTDAPLGPVNGRTQNVSFEYILSAVKFYFSLTFTTTAPYVFTIVDDNKIKERESTYWEIVKNVIPLPPSACFEHLPSPGSLFDIEGARWKFCFILLNDNQKKGVLISGFGIR